MLPLTDADLLQELSVRKALVVHFSNHADMNRAGAGVFPKDLLNAINNRHEWTLSCCVVWPRHFMDLPGSVGVIFRPNVASVRSVCNEDSGASSSDDNACDYSAGSALDRASLAATFNVAMGRYNEWRVKGAEVVGIYIDRIDSIEVRKVIKFEDPVTREMLETTSPEIASLEEVFSSFPEYPVFTFDAHGILQIR